jgi:hypothetical protein
MTRLPPRRDQRPALNARIRNSILIAYAAIGPLLLWSLYTVSRDRAPAPGLEQLDDVVLFGVVASGAYCAFRAMPSHSRVRLGVTFVYGLCMTFAVLGVALWIECARGNCL